MPNKAVSDYMREMQHRSAESRWSELSPEQRSAKMKAIRAAAAKKPRTKTKARGLRQNAESSHAGPVTPGLG